MCNQRPDHGRAARGRLTALLQIAAVSALLALAGCRGTPSTPGAQAGADEHDKVLQEIADYSLWVRQQSDEALRGELQRLQDTSESAGRALRLALITGQRQSALYDPDRTAQLLARVAGEGPDTSVHVQLAQALLGVLPSFQRQCAATECEDKLMTLAEVEERRRNELTTRIDSLGRQLESERNLREKLERQVEALKSLEAQIKNRDGPQTP